MPRLSWTAPALRDLRAIESFLEAEASSARSARMLTAIRAKAELLQSFSHAGPPWRGTEVRSLRVPGTPYLLTYRLQLDGVEILRVYHERQNWRDAFT